MFFVFYSDSANVSRTALWLTPVRIEKVILAGSNSQGHMKYSSHKRIRHGDVAGKQGGVDKSGLCRENEARST